MKRPSVSRDKGSDMTSAQLSVGLGARSYDIHIGGSQLSRLGDILSEFAPAKRVAVITDKKVESLYGGAIRKALQDYTVHMLSLIHI